MMTLPQRRQPSLARQHNHGFVLILVVFLIVVLGGAAVAISQLTVDSSGAQNQALQKTRAQWFSQSGVEWAVRELINDGTDCNLDDIDHQDFPGLTLQLSCHSQNVGLFTLWTVTATAETSSQDATSREYVWQQMTAVVELEN